MTKIPFLERISQDVPLLGDGAMGTLLHARGNLPINGCFEALNIDDPDLVAQIHQEYVKAGADIIETNTFGANVYKLTEYGLGDKVAAINTAAVELARWAAARRDDLYIVGSVGPLGVPMKPFGKLPKEDARAAFKQQMQALSEGGIDAFLLETFTNHGELLEAIAAAREVNPDTPVIAQMTFNADDRTLDRLSTGTGRRRTVSRRSGCDRCELQRRTGTDYTGAGNDAQFRAECSVLGDAQCWFPGEHWRAGAVPGFGRLLC